MNKNTAAKIIFFVLSISLVSSVFGETSATIRVENKEMPISGDLFGIFFEDLNYAADGGLYPERVQNRSFEYSREDNRDWHSLSFWRVLQDEDGQVRISVETDNPLNANNPHYAVLSVEKKGGRNGLSNDGFDGIVLTKGEKYDVSLFARTFSSNPVSIVIKVENPEGDILGQTKLSGLKKEWTKHQSVIEATADEANARFIVLISGTGQIGLDMISLFPQKTFKNRPNGLRPDLAQVIADLKPKFIRFPGGCLVHGDGLENMYRWKESIGPIEERKAQRNIWRYHQTLGLGYFEYFQFCEDIGAKPLPVVPAGVCCQNSGNYLNLVPRGQQGLPLEKMDEYVQEVLDLVEYANGPVTSKWGAKRAEAGHPEPFNLEYLGVGNEDVISETFRVRYKMINDAVKAKYPDIIVIGTTGPFTDGRDYDEGWKYARQEKLPMVDEHGYKSPAWFWENLKRFDFYERAGTSVYLGEYAAHDTGRANTLRSALAEAAYMTSLERNGDLVRLSSYAPLLAKQGHTQWRPDMIYFDNVSITPSINYYVQQLFSVNRGDAYLPTTVKIQTSPTSELTATPNGVLLGSWDTKARFDEIKIINGDKVVLNESFDNTGKNWEPLSGQWRSSDGVYSQSSDETPALSMYPFEDNQSGYTVTLKAMKTEGTEGFLVGFGALDANDYYWLNLGGWGNTRHAIEKTMNGARSAVGSSVNGRIESNRWYDIKIQVVDSRIKCYLDGELIINVTDRGFVKTPDVAASTVRDTTTGDVILKIVSKADEAIPVEIDLSDIGSFEFNATKTVLSGDEMAVNRFGQIPTVLPQVSRIQVSQTFEYEIPPHSLTVIRTKTSQVEDNETVVNDVPAEQDMAAYLMVYFSDSDHSLHMALSSDGYSFTAINDNKPIIEGHKIASQKGIRDPHITRGPDGAFYVAMTDLHIFAQRERYRNTQWERDAAKYDWGNNRGFVLMKSFDLIHWTDSNVLLTEAFDELKDIGCAWAPQTIYDPEADKMMLYFTMRLGHGRTKLYYAYTDDDFTKLTTLPRSLFEYPDDKIQILDADITQLPDGRYCMMYVAQESPAGIKMAFSDHINRGYVYQPEQIDFERGSCEAPNVWKRIGQEKWVLMVDVFSIRPHNFSFSETSDFVTFKNLGHFNRGDMKTTNFSSPKHGAVIHLTKQETDCLARHWGLEKY